MNKSRALRSIATTFQATAATATPVPKQKKPPTAKDFQLKYKTELCRLWENGACPYENACAFAHGAAELRSKIHLPKNYRTKRCKRFFQTGYCSYGFRCQFRHEESQQRTAPNTPRDTQPVELGRRLPVFIDLEARGCN